MVSETKNVKKERRMMKQIKLYNVIFPIWLLMFLPPVAVITLAGNFIIDSLVIAICFFVFKVGDAKRTLKTFYSKSILKVWLFGFLADIVGAAILLAICTTGDLFGLPFEVESAISYDPFRNPTAVIIVVFAMLISALFIFLFNYKITFKNQIADKKLRIKLALTIAIVTIPWTFLLPTKWFYYKSF